MAQRKKTTGKKVASKTKAGSKSKGLVTWEQRFKDSAVDQRARMVAVQAANLGIDNGKFNSGGQVFGTEVYAILIEYGYFRAYYDSQFVKGEVGIPACYAFNMNPDNLKPADNSPKPQCETCEGCWADAFETSQTGRGKACGESFKFVMLFAKSMDELQSLLEKAATNPDKAELVVFKNNTSSIKHFKPHLNAILERMERPLWSVVTKMTLEQEGNVTVCIPEVYAPLINEGNLFDTLDELRSSKAVSDMLLAPVDCSQYGKSKKKGFSKKKLVKKKVVKKGKR